MIRCLALATLLLPLTADAANWAIFQDSGTGTVMGDVPFALPIGSTLKFMAPTGNDACNGTSPSIGTSGNCAWLTTNHPMKCGEVIIAAPGSYLNNNFSDIWGTVSNCPSASGGIDGLGQIYFAILLCGGTEISSSTSLSCQAGGSGGPSNPNAYMEFAGGQSNWAVEGFYIDAGSSGSLGFGYRTCTLGALPIGKSHHLAFINSVVNNAGQALYSNDCGDNNGTAEGGDYIAGIGIIAVNSNLAANFYSYSSGAIAPGALTNWDTNPGTHVFLYNNYGPTNIVHGADNLFDGEFIYYDTPDVHHFTQTAVTMNNLAYITTRWCYSVTYNGGFGGPWPATFEAYNNSCLNGWSSGLAGNPGGNIDFANNGCCPAVSNPLTHIFQNNVSQTTFPSGVAPGGATVYALNLQGHVGTLTFGGTGVENVLISTVPSCTAGDCDATNFAATIQVGDPYPSGTNFYPAQGTTIFANTADLVNQISVPRSCAGFVNTTACMGWNANTHTLTSNTFIADLQCVYANCTGKGFQLPSTTCVTSGTLFNVYPAWLKGVVYLHWTGSAIVQKADLVTRPCGM
jgi:hypothetical protein